MWLDKLKPGQSWWGIWYGLGHCTVCGALHRQPPCPVCGDEQHVDGITFRDQDGKEYTVPPARQGAIAGSTSLLLAMMQREWERPLSTDHWLNERADSPPQRVALVLLFWILFEGLLERLYDAALSVCPDGIRNDLLKRYGLIGPRMTQLHTALFGCTLLEDLKAQGDERLGVHLAELHHCRNSFVHGDPEAIRDELVKRTVELLQDVQEAYVRLYNRRCTHLPRVIPVWDERSRR